MAFPLCFTYHIRHNSCLNTQAGSNSHAMLLLRHHQSFGGGERDLNQIKKRAESPRYPRSACPPSYLQDCQVTSSHFISPSAVTAPGPVILDFPPNKHPFAIHLPKANAANSAPEIASELHHILQMSRMTIFFVCFTNILCCIITNQEAWRGEDVYPSLCTIYFVQCTAFSTATAPYSAGKNAIEVFLTSKEAEVKEPSTESRVFSQVCYIS